MLGYHTTLTKEYKRAWVLIGRVDAYKENAVLLTSRKFPRFWLVHWTMHFLPYGEANIEIEQGNKFIGNHILSSWWIECRSNLSLHITSSINNTSRCRVFFLVWTLIWPSFSIHLAHCSGCHGYSWRHGIYVLCWGKRYMKKNFFFFLLRLLTCSMSLFDHNYQKSFRFSFSIQILKPHWDINNNCAN